MKRSPETTSVSALERSPGPATVGVLAFVTAVVTGFGAIVIGNDLGPVLADTAADRTAVWAPLLVFLCAPLSVIAGASALASVTGSRRPTSSLAAAAVVFGTMVGAGIGRAIWRFLELQYYGSIVGQLDSMALLTMVGSVLLGGVAGALIGERVRSTEHADRVSQFSIILATALLTYPTMELIAGRAEVGNRQLWMLAFMLFALALAPRIGLRVAEGSDGERNLTRHELSDLHADRDESAAVRLLIGFSAGWMASILVNMSSFSYDGQLTRYLLAWTLPVLLMAPGVLAHLDRIGRRETPQAAIVETFNR